LQLRIIIAACALVGVGPAVIEDVFALAVRFQIAGGDRVNLAAFVFDDKMLREPSRPAADRFRGFE